VTVTRRGLLRGLLLALGAEHLVAPGALRRRAAEAAAGAPENAVSPHEMDDLVAFAEILLEGRPLSAEERGHLVAHIETRIRLNSWYLTLYRTSVAYVNQVAGTRVSTLDVAERTALLTRHHLLSATIGVDEDPAGLPDPARDLRTRAVPDLIGGYYNSPVGWAVVGYDVFPGTCGDLSRYTRAEP
jgi:hypothetical protein